MTAEPGATEGPTELAPCGDSLVGTVHPGSGPWWGHTPGWATEGGSPVASRHVLLLVGGTGGTLPALGSAGSDSAIDEGDFS